MRDERVPLNIKFRHLVRTQDGTTEVLEKYIRVYTLLACHRGGESPEELAEGYDVPLAAVYEALAYAADHVEEMDEIRKADEEAEARILARLPLELTRGLDLS